MAQAWPAACCDCCPARHGVKLEAFTSGVVSDVSVLANVMTRGAATVLLGVALGLVAALAAMRALAGSLFQVNAADPGVLLGVGAFLALVALVATYVPARRAARLDPMVALRTD